MVFFAEVWYSRDTGRRARYGEIAVHIQNGYAVQNAVCEASGLAQETGSSVVRDTAGKYRAVCCAEPGDAAGSPGR